MKALLLSILLLVLSSVAMGQVNADSLFAVARSHVAQKEYEKARTLLNTALEAYPEYDDIRVYIGRTYAWEGAYDKAIPYFTRTLERDSTQRQAWIALGDVGLWSEDNASVINNMRLAEKKLENDSTGLNEVRVRMASALYAQREYRRALDVLEQTHGTRSERLRQGTLLRLVNNSVDVYGSAEFFDTQYDNMYYSTIQVGQSTRYGVAIARVNVANRFDETGYQGEIDLYPHITDRIYGYLNYGYSSNATVFPRHRIGGEIYSAVGSAFEASLGVRYLYFGSASSVTMYTGSFSYYYNKYWFALRPFITPQEDGTDVSVALSARRFLKDSRSWITFNANYGFSPDARRIQVGGGEQIEILQTTKVGLEWQQAVTTDWLFVIGMNYTRQELPFDPGNFVNIYAPSLGIKRLL